MNVIEKTQQEPKSRREYIEDYIYDAKTYGGFLGGTLGGLVSGSLSRPLLTKADSLLGNNLSKNKFIKASLPLLLTLLGASAGSSAGSGLAGLTVENALNHRDLMKSVVNRISPEMNKNHPIISHYLAGVGIPTLTGAGIYYGGKGLSKAMGVDGFKFLPKKLRTVLAISSALGLGTSLASNATTSMSNYSNRFLEDQKYNY